MHPESAKLTFKNTVLFDRMDDIGVKKQDRDSYYKFLQLCGGNRLSGIDDMFEAYQIWMIGR